MALYIGYQTLAAKLREEWESNGWVGDSDYPKELIDRIAALRNNLPDGCTLMGVYNPVGDISPATPGVMLIETDDPANLQFISSHYRGMLNYVWVPAFSVPTTSAGVSEQLNE